MKKIVLTFGLISGAIVSGMMIITLPFHDAIGFDRSLIVGYTSMVLAFLLVFFGVRSYRDNIAGGTVGFGRGFAVGASEESISLKKAEMDKFAVMYKNPAINAALTFAEPLPVGLIVALVSAGVLSRRKKSPAGG